MSDLYLVIVEDRHTDVDVWVYRDRENAINAAMDYLRDRHEQYADGIHYERRGAGDWVRVIGTRPTFDEYYGTEADPVERAYRGEPYIRRTFDEHDDRLLFAKYTVEDDYITVKPTEIEEE